MEVFICCHNGIKTRQEFDSDAFVEGVGPLIEFPVTVRRGRGSCRRGISTARV